MCYTFDLLGPDFTASHIRHCVSAFEDNVRDGWVCWAFSNHDVKRHVSRFIEQESERERVAKLAITVLATLRGSICLYQGEELALPEAELELHELRDPYGIRFWPAFKGRDGCRTPMPWTASAANAGFTTGKPWLPVPAEHKALAVDAQEGDEASVLAHYRATLAFRKAHDSLYDGGLTFLDTNQDVLIFTREKAGERLLFLFNLRRGPQSVPVPKGLTVTEAIPLPGFDTATLEKGEIRLEALDAFCGRVSA